MPEPPEGYEPATYKAFLTCHEIRFKLPALMPPPLPLPLPPSHLPPSRRPPKSRSHCRKITARRGHRERSGRRERAIYHRSCSCSRAPSAAP